jgi:putative nucleotidyltransferase with HDIG domain
VAGLLSIEPRHGQQFDPSDVSALETLAEQLSSAINNATLYEDLFISTVRTLAHALEAKDRYTHGHSRRVTEYALRIGRKLGVAGDELQLLEVAGLLHDVGKIGIPETVLNKPGPLTESETAVVQAHPVWGADIVHEVRRLRKVSPAIRHHHERYDGSGYPDKLQGNEIPFLARVLAAADSLDAMTSDRAYRKRLPLIRVTQEFRAGSGRQFEPAVVDALLGLMAERVFREAIAGVPA